MWAIDESQDISKIEYCPKKPIDVRLKESALEFTGTSVTEHDAKPEATFMDKYIL